MKALTRLLQLVLLLPFLLLAMAPPGAIAAGLDEPTIGYADRVQGTISTQNLTPTVAATTNSAVEITLNGASRLGVDVRGTYTGALSLQTTLDGVNWTTGCSATCTTTFTKFTDNTTGATIASGATGYYTVTIGPAFKARITGLAAMGGTGAVVTLRGDPSAGGSSSAGGSGTADSTAANQVLQIAVEGATTDPAIGDANGSINGHARNSAKYAPLIQSDTSRLTSSASPKAPGGALATTALQIAGTYNSGGVTLTNTQEAGAQMTAAGAIQVNDAAVLAKFPASLGVTSAPLSFAVAAAGASVSGSATVNGALSNFPVLVRGYKSVFIQITVISGGTANFEFSNDNVTYYAAAQCAVITNTGSSGLNGQATAVGLYRCPVAGAYFQVRESGGPVNQTAVVELSQADTPGVTPVNISGGGGSITFGQQSVGSTAVNFPVGVGCRTEAAAPTAVTNGQEQYVECTTTGKVLTFPYSPPELNWNYAAAASGIVNTTTAVAFKAAAAAGIRNYLTAIDLMCEALTNATEVAVRDGAAGTVLWRTKVSTGGLTGGRHIYFPQPLQGTAATLMEVVTLTASGAGACYFNASGFIAP